MPGSARKSRFESTTSAHAFVETSARSARPATTPKNKNVGRSMGAPSGVTTGGGRRDAHHRDRKSRALEGDALDGDVLGGAASLEGDAVLAVAEPVSSAGGGSAFGARGSPGSLIGADYLRYSSTARYGERLTPENNSLLIQCLMAGRSRSGDKYGTSV